MALFSTNNNTFANAELALLLKFYQNEDLVLGRMLCDYLGVKSHKQISEADLKKYIADNNNNLADAATIKRTLNLAKLFTLLHAESPAEYRLPTDIKIAITRDIKNKLTADQKSALANLDAQEHDNLLFGYLESAELFSDQDISNLLHSINTKYSNSYGISEKLNYLNNGKKIPKVENAIKDGIEQLAKTITGGFLEDAFNDKDKPKDRPITEKDFFVNPKGNSLEKMFSSDQRKHFRDSLELLKDLKPKVNAKGETVSGEQLYNKFNTISRRVLEEAREDYADESSRAQSIAKMQFIAIKLAAVLRQNGFSDNANELLANFAVKDAKDDNLGSTFKKKNYLSKEEVTKKTKEFFSKFKELLGFKSIDKLLHDKNPGKPLNKQIADHVNSKPILDKVVDFGNKLEQYPDAQEARRKFANRLSKLRTALLNYETAADAAERLGEDIAADVVPMDVLFKEFQKHYDKLYDRIDTKYFDVSKIATERKAELEKTKAKLHNMSLNSELRKKNFEVSLKNIKTKQREKQAASYEEMKDLELLPEKLQDIQRLQAKIAEANKLLNARGEITGEQIVKIRELEKECDDLYAKTEPPKSSVPQQPQAGQQQQQMQQQESGHPSPSMGQ